MRVEVHQRCGRPGTLGGQLRPERRTHWAVHAFEPRNLGPVTFAGGVNRERSRHRLLSAPVVHLLGEAFH